MRAILSRFKRHEVHQDTLERRKGAMELWKELTKDER